jgi:NTE family protein
MKKSIALVLSSGGARGMAHIGIIEELEKHGYKITSVAGSSMGALVGGIYAAGKLPVLKEWLCSLDKKGVFDLIDFTFSSKGLIKGDRIIKRLKKMIPDQKIEDLKIPFCAVATDIVNCREIVFNSGSLYDAIRASISIPTVFVPFIFNENQLVDGGVVNPIPVNRVKRKKNDLLVVSNVNARISCIENLPDLKSDHYGYFRLIKKSISLMIHQISMLTIEKYQPDILINVSRDSLDTFVFYKAAVIIKIGEQAARRVLNDK